MCIKQFHYRDLGRASGSGRTMREPIPRPEGAQRPGRYYSLMLPREFMGIRS